MVRDECTARSIDSMIAHVHACTGNTGRQARKQESNHEHAHLCMLCWELRCCATLGRSCRRTVRSDLYTLTPRRTARLRTRQYLTRAQPTNKG